MTVNNKARITSRIMFRYSTRTAFILIGGLILYTFCAKAFTFGTILFTEEGVADRGKGKEVVITIPKEASAGEIASILKDNGLIEDKIAFMFQTYLYEAEIYSGTYKLNTEFSPEELISAMMPEEEKSDSK